MKKLVDLYQIQVVWNREFTFINYSTPEQEFSNAKAKAESIINSGDGARVKKYRIIDSYGNIVYPLVAKVTPKNYKVAYKIWYDERNYIHEGSTRDNLMFTTNVKYAMKFTNHVKELEELGMYESLFKRYDKLYLK
jgi:hypothetical protein